MPQGVEVDNLVSQPLLQGGIHRRRRRKRCDFSSFSYEVRERFFQELQKEKDYFICSVGTSAHRNWKMGKSMASNDEN